VVAIASSTGWKSASSPVKASTGRRWIHFGYTKIHVPDEFYRRYERLLEGGIWAIVDIEFRMSEDGSKGSPFHIADLRPIQLARFDLDE
jgi:ATP-dependent Lon protease